MQNKTLILATFLQKENTEETIKTITEKFDLKKSDIFMFETDKGDLIFTYRLTIDVGTRFSIKDEIKNTIQVHKKSKTFFTINSLNKLVELDSGLESGNVSHKDHQIDWSKYEDKMILLNNDGLNTINLKKVFL